MAGLLTKKIENQINNFNQKLTPPFPKGNMLLELTNICNHRCIFCANKKMKRKKGYMDFDFCKNILLQAYNEGGREVGFYATGEPLVYPKLTEVIKYAKEIGFEYTYITTNGALFTKEKAVELINAGLDSIKFSINATDKDTYKLIHGVDDFDRVIENLKMLYEYRKTSGKKFKIFISHVATRFTEDKLKDFKEKYSEYCDDIAFMPVINQCGHNSEMKDLLSCQTSSELLIHKPISPIPCARIFNGLAVSYEGYLTACCVDFENYLIVADLNKVSLKDAWNSEKFQELRQKHINKDVDGLMCQNCCNYSEKEFQPLQPEYATKIDFKELYDKNPIINRIEKYRGTNG